MTEVIDTGMKEQIQKEDGTWVEVGLKEGDFQSIDEILAYPNVVCNLMPAAYYNDKLDRMEYVVEFTLEKPHPHAVYSCRADQWKTSDAIKKEWREAQNKLQERYIERKAEQEILRDMGINEAEIRNG